jgi:serine/threonine protein phosphatase PrpC
MESAINDSCVAIDKDFLLWCKENRKYSGTTALGAFIYNSALIVFNIGDSMAVMSSGGKAVSNNSNTLLIANLFLCRSSLL